MLESLVGLLELCLNFLQLLITLVEFAGSRFGSCIVGTHSKSGNAAEYREDEDSLIRVIETVCWLKMIDGKDTKHQPNSTETPSCDMGIEFGIDVSARELMTTREQDETRDGN